MDYPKSVPGVGLVGGKFIDEDSVHGIQGSLIPSAWGNSVTNELLNVIRGADLVPIEGDHGQVLEALMVLLAESTSGLARVKTFAQAIALTEDIGPVLVIGMDGVWEWTASAHFTGYRHPRCGHWEDGWTPTPLPFQIVATGGTWKESDEKERRVIARYRESGLVVPSGSWIKGQNMISDLGSGNWKAPDLQDMFKRMSGTDADTANAMPLGMYQADAMQRITGTFGAYVWSVGGAFHSTETTGGSQNGTSPYSVVTFDAQRVARTSVETRAASSRAAPFVHV